MRLALRSPRYWPCGPLPCGPLPRYWPCGPMLIVAWACPTASSETRSTTASNVRIGHLQSRHERSIPLRRATAPLSSRAVPPPHRDPCSRERRRFDRDGVDRRRGDARRLQPGEWRARDREPARVGGAPHGDRERGRGPRPARPVQNVKVKNDWLTIKGGKSGWGFTLDEPRQGEIAVRLQLGTAEPWCSEAPAKLTGKHPTSAKTDRVDLFIAQTKTPAPEQCPLLGSPS